MTYVYRDAACTRSLGGRPHRTCTYKPSQPYVGAAALSGKCFLKIKRGAQGETERFKTRYVVRGFEQVLGIDFNGTWAPVGHCTTLRCLLVICSQEGLETMHADIKCAFQNGKMPDLVYVIQPEELGDGSGKVWRLRKALYGLK